MLVYIEVNNQLLQAAAAKPSLVVTDNNRTALAISILCLRADAVECLSRTDRIHRHGIPWIRCMYSIGKRSNDVRSNTWCLPIKQTPLYIQDNVADKHIRRLTDDVIGDMQTHSRPYTSQSAAAGDTILQGKYGLPVE